MPIKYRDKIIILCEGDTEVNAVDFFLKRKLHENKPSCSISPFNIDSKTKKTKTYSRIALDGDAVAVLTLYDIYKFECPNYGKNDTTKEKIKKAKEYLIRESGLKGYPFFPHFAVHETEAWFFSENYALQNFLEIKDSIVHPHPETINFQNYPSKRVNTLCLRHRKSRYDKRYDSQKIFQKLNFEAVLANCPYFKAFWEDILSLCQ